MPPTARELLLFVSAPVTQEVSPTPLAYEFERVEYVAKVEANLRRAVRLRRRYVLGREFQCAVVSDLLRAERLSNVLRSGLPDVLRTGNDFVLCAGDDGILRARNNCVLRTGDDGLLRARAGRLPQRLVPGVLFESRADRVVRTADNVRRFVSDDVCRELPSRGELCTGRQLMLDLRDVQRGLRAVVQHLRRATSDAAAGVLLVFDVQRVQRLRRTECDANRLCRIAAVLYVRRDAVECGLGPDASH